MSWGTAAKIQLLTYPIMEMEKPGRRIEGMVNGEPGLNLAILLIRPPLHLNPSLYDVNRDE
jgi:hypothetical protein